MSTNISEIMFEMEQAGMARERVAELVLALIVAGQRTIIAARTEQAVARLVVHEGRDGSSASVTRVSR